MNRDIEFKGKDETGKWFFGNLVIDIDKVYICEHDSRYLHEVIAETVGEYTGLLCRNGVKVFEGDIIRITWEGNVMIHKVEWSNGCFHVDDAYIDEFINDNLDYFEVIGSIHDNKKSLSE